MTPKELLFVHRYLEAIDAYSDAIRKNPAKNLYGGLARALLSARKYKEALECFRLANEREKLEGSCPYIVEVGVSLWLMNQQEEAVDTWHQAVVGITEGTIRYGDLAGGASQGLLLWYGAIKLKNETEREFSIDYLRTLRERKVYGKAILWPRPVMMMVLGDFSFAKVLEQATGFPEISPAIKSSSMDLLKRRRICQVLFYSACRDRASDKEAECLKKMRLCCSLENPIIEAEWYLARAENDATV